eukprot:5210914-Amphidinium_carterae.1
MPNDVCNLSGARKQQVRFKIAFQVSVHENTDFGKRSVGNDLGHDGMANAHMPPHTHWPEGGAGISPRHVKKSSFCLAAASH